MVEAERSIVLFPRLRVPRQMTVFRLGSALFPYFHFFPLFVFSFFYGRFSPHVPAP